MFIAHQIIHRIPISIAVCGTLATLSVVNAAEGTRLIGSGPVQHGTAGAGVAAPQNSSWLSLNPAGLTELAARSDVSTDIITGTVEITPQGALGNTAAGTMTDNVLVYAPAVSTCWHQAGLTFGLGAYTVSGLAIDLPASRSSLAAPSGYDRRGEQRFMTTGLAIADQVTDSLSIAVCLNINYVDIRSDSITTNLTQTAGAYERDAALGAGFSLSLLQQFDTWSVGAQYASRQWMQTLDKYRDAFIGTPDQPQSVQVGVAWRPLPWLEPMLDYRYLDWSSVRFYGEGLLWDDQHIVKLGCLLRPHETVTFRAGLSYGKSPIDEGAVFINGLSPLVSEWHGTIGASWLIDGQWSIDIAYQHAFKNEVVDDGSDVNGLGAGTTISAVVNTVILGVGRSF